MKPDFERMRTALFLGEPDRVPLVELWVDSPIKAAFLGEPVEDVVDCRKANYDVKKDIEFWNKAGYDYIRIMPRYEFPKCWLSDPKAILKTSKDLDTYPWPEYENVDYSSIIEAKKYLPPGMKVIAGTEGGIYEETWLTIGFETTMLAIIEKPDFIKEVFSRIGKFHLKMFEKLAQFDHVGALWLGDDIAYAEGLIMAPDYLRKWIFPWYERFADVAKRHNIPFLFHSDGNLWQVMEDLIHIGVNGLHPIEPKAMDVRELKEKVGNRLCILGTVDLDYPLSRGTPKEVREMVKERMKYIAPGGGFCIGSSNSIAHYVPLENYKALIDATFEYGRYPINL
jgi:uroporphyrinogen decarboxylase